MKTFAAVLTFAWLAAAGAPPAVAAAIEGLHTPSPAYPEQARQAHVAGSGICEVTFGQSGAVSKAIMLKSTGSDLLDQNTLDWARKHWTGKPNTRVQVPIVYQPSLDVDHPPEGYHLPKPPYSHLALTHLLMGEGRYQVTFGADGHAANVVTLKSTGSGILDSRTVEWATLYWTGLPNTKIVVTFNYVIR